MTTVQHRGDTPAHARRADQQPPVLGSSRARAFIPSNLGQVIGRAITTRSQSDRRHEVLGPVEREILSLLRRHGDLTAKDILTLDPAIFASPRGIEAQRSMLCITLSRLMRRGYAKREGKPRSYTYTARGPLNLDWLGMLP